ncbi:MAG: site-2 protease family protein [Acidilobaceae archaeon]
MVSHITLLLVVIVLVFWVILWLIFRGRKGRVQVYPLVIIARTGLSREAYSKSFKAKILSLFGWPAIILMFILQVLFYYIAINLFITRYLAPPAGGPTTSEGFVPLIPGVTIPLDLNLALILVAVGLAVLFHELGHALMARAIGVRVKDAGFILLAFIPGAFVELNEEDLKNASLRNKAKVYSSGVAANILLALIAIPLLLVASNTLALPAVIISSVEPGSIAERSGLEPGVAILEINGTRIESVAKFIEVLESLGVRDKSKSVTLNIVVSRDNVEESLIVFKPEGYDRLGVTISQGYIGGFITVILITLLQVLIVINIALALINAAPIILPTPAGAIATDGAHFLGDILARIGGEKLKQIATPAIGVITLALVLSLLTIQTIRFIP